VSKSGWTRRTLSELLDVRHGYAFQGQHFSDSGELVLLTPGNFGEKGGLRLKGDREKYYLGQVPPGYLLHKGEILVAMTDLMQEAPILGSALIIPENGRFLHNQRLGKVVNLRQDLVSLEFVPHLFNSPDVRAQIRGSASGATVRHTSPTRIREVSVDLPPLSVQHLISRLLSAYDDLVSNALRRAALLEEIAQSLYAEWFVHLRFPGHEGTEWSQSSSGSIPTGWEVLQVPECVDVNPRTKIPPDGEKFFVPMGSLSGDSMVISDIEIRAGNSGAKFKNGDTLFARITPCLENGKTGFVQFLPDASTVAFGSTEFIVLRSRVLTPEFVYLLARSADFRANAIKSMSGATGRQRVQEQCFDSFLVPVPPTAILDRFSTLVTPIFHLVHQLHLMVNNLRATRDLLLPRLMSGQLTLPEAEEAVPASL
jgi:type I restriction enzyme S subunit